MSSCVFTICRDRLRTCSNVLSHAICAYITNEFVKNDLDIQDNKDERLNGNEIDVEAMHPLD